MSNIELIHGSCADQKVDAVVNAANANLAYGGGICKVIFERAGVPELKAACREYQTPLRDGAAVKTLSFNMKNAKAIIHAVGPDFSRTPKAFKELYEAYYNSLLIIRDNGYHSISFPLISSGIFGGDLSNAVTESAKQCIRAYKSFIRRFPDYEIDVKLCAYTADEMREASIEFERRLGNDDISIDETNRSKIDTKEKNDDMPNTPDDEYSRWNVGANAFGKVGEPIPWLEESSGARKKYGVQEFTINGRREYAVFFHMPDEPYGWLSNWYRSEFELDGMKFSSVEQYIMYQKCVLFGDLSSASRIMETDDPAVHQLIGKNASGFIEKVWNGYRQVVAEKALYAKFSQDEFLKEKLLLTQDIWLVESANGDKNWACGIGMDDDRRLDASNWTGMNILGFSLMKVREDLRKENV